MNKRLIIALAAGAVLVGGYFAWRAYQSRDDLPRLPIADLDGERRAGKADLVRGDAFMRPAVPEDYRRVQVADPKTSSGWTKFATGGPLLLGTLINVPQGADVQLQTAGNFIAAVKNGEFILEDARTDEARGTHTIFWRVKKGSFRIKPHDYDPSMHLIQVITPTARIIVHKGEIGMSINEGAGGQFWLVSGKATLLWNDGRRKEMTVKGIEAI